MEALPENEFDLVISFFSSEGIPSAELYLTRAKRILKPGGLFLFIGNVGSSSVAENDKFSLEILNQIPNELRLDLQQSTSKKAVLREIIVTPHFDPVPPRFLKTCAEHFQLVEQKPLAGTLAAAVFNTIAGNFDEKDPEHVEVLKMIFNTEQELYLKKKIEPRAVFSVFRKN